MSHGRITKYVRSVKNLKPKWIYSHTPDPYPYSSYSLQLTSICFFLFPHTGDLNWFAEGKLNACYNCVDKHLPHKADQTAIIWDGDEIGKLTFNEKKILNILIAYFFVFLLLSAESLHPFYFMFLTTFFLKFYFLSCFVL